MERKSNHPGLGSGYLDTPKLPREVFNAMGADRIDKFYNRLDAWKEFNDQQALTKMGAKQIDKFYNRLEAWRKLNDQEKARQQKKESFIDTH